MRHATILDAFNAAAGVTQQALGYLDQRNREEADAFLSTVPDEFRNERLRIINENPFNYTGDPDDLEGLKNYTLEYADELRKKTSEWYAKKFGGKANIGYYKKAKDQMEQHEALSLRNHALVRAEEWRTNYEIGRFGKNIESYKDTMPPEEAWAAFGHSLNLLKTRLEITPQQQERLRADYGKTLYTKTLSDGLMAVGDVNNLESELEKLKGRFDFMPAMEVSVFDENGKAIGKEKRAWSFDGKEDWEKNLLERETKRIQGKHFEAFRERQAYMERLVLSGDINGAIAYAKVHGAEWNKYYNVNNSEFANSNDDYRDRGSGFFDWKTLEGYKKQGAAGENALKMQFHWRQFLNAAVTGSGEEINGEWTTFGSIEEAYDRFFVLSENAFYYANGGENEVTRNLWQYKKAELENNFYDQMRNYLRDTDTQLLNTYDKFIAANTYTDPKSEFFNKDFEDDRGQRAISFFKNLFFKNRITDSAKIEAEMKQFTGKELSNLLAERKMPKDSGEEFQGEQIKKAANVSKIVMGEKADDTVFVKANMERNGIMGDGRSNDIVWRDKNQEQFYTRFQEYERGKVADILEVERGSLNADWMDSTRRKGDIIPKGKFTVTKGEKKGTYYLDYDDNANEVLMKLDTKTKEWKEEKTTERPLTQSEVAKRNENYALSIKNGKDPRTGEALDFDYKRTPPPGSPLTQAQWDDPIYRIQKDVVWANYFLQQRQ